MFVKRGTTVLWQGDVIVKGARKRGQAASVRPTFRFRSGGDATMV
jgi:hypothetical protein